MLSSVIKWLIDKLGTLLTVVGSGIGIATNELTPIFIVVAMIGVLLTMMGNKKWGTKLSSLSFFIYLLFKVVFKC